MKIFCALFFDKTCLIQVTRPNTRLSCPSGSSKYGDLAYGNQFVAAAVSKEARDDAKAARLWDLSAKVLDVAS